MAPKGNGSDDSFKLTDAAAAELEILKDLRFGNALPISGKSSQRADLLFLKVGQNLDLDLRGMLSSDGGAMMNAVGL